MIFYGGEAAHTHEENLHMIWIHGSWSERRERLHVRASSTFKRSNVPGLFLLRNQFLAAMTRLVHANSTSTNLVYSMKKLNYEDTSTSPTFVFHIGANIFPDNARYPLTDVVHRSGSWYLQT